jgi:long-chain acyl-CoA synthetase
LDEDGYLFITGRKKELIVTAAGKNIAPVHLEALLAEDPLIAQAMVIGDGRNFLTALIVPNPEPLKREIIARGIPVGSPQEALVHPRVRELYAERIKSRLAAVSTYEQVKQFTLLGQGFTIESGELTPTLKLRRDTIARNYAQQIAEMYDPDRLTATR